MAEAISLEKLYEELKKLEAKMVTREEIDSFMETLEVLDNPETVKKIWKGLEDIKHGRITEFKSVKELLA